MKIRVKFDRHLNPGSIITTDPYYGTQYIMDTDGLLRVVTLKENFELNPQEFIPGTKFTKINHEIIEPYCSEIEEVPNKEYIVL